MSKCRWTKQAEAWADGEAGNPAAVEAHVEACAACRAHVEGLRIVRAGVAAVRRNDEIRDPQLAAFVSGIRERLEEPPRSRSRSRFWALLSLSAAALIVALSAFFMITNGLGKVDATVVESCGSDLQGATVTSYSSDNGVTTVWVTASEDDVW